jgi:hypothetical protein
MKKIIIVFNGINAPWHILRFATNIAKINGALAQGIFLMDHEIKDPFPNDLALTETHVNRESLSEEDAILESHNITMFENICKTSGVDCQVEKNVSLEELIEQSRQADLIITDTTPDLQEYSLNDILKDAHCPVCLVSIITPVVEKIILLYNGSASSKFAIERFCDLFPGWTHLPTTLLSINQPEKIENDEYSAGWLPKHFTQLDNINLHGNEKRELVNFLNKDANNVLVVMGAFGRSVISRFFHHSLSNVILGETKVSLFTTHK